MPHMHIQEIVEKYRVYVYGRLDALVRSRHFKEEKTAKKGAQGIKLVRTVVPVRAPALYLKYYRGGRKPRK